MKKLSNILFIFLITFITTNTVKAIPISAESIPDNSYVIGKYLYTSSYKVDDKTITGTDIYDGTGKLYTPAIMLGASSISSSNYDDMIIYYKFMYWMDAYRGTTIELTQEDFEITHINGVCVDPSCSGELFDITFQYSYKAGQVQTKTIQVNYGDKITSSQLPALENRPGYKFVCWTIKGSEEQADNSDCFDFNIGITDDGVRIPTGSKSLQLEAKWEQITYNVTYHANFDDTSKSVECRYFEEGHPNNCQFSTYESLNLTPHTDYHFLGWATTPNGKTLYQPETEMKVILEDEENIDLYAIWSADDYLISYKLDGGTFTTTANVPHSFNTDDESIKLVNPSRTGYTFNGWILDNGQKFDGTALPHRNIELTATWTPITYTFTLDSQVKTCTYDEKCDLDFETERAGQKLVGLFVDLPNGEGGTVKTQLPQSVFNFTTEPTDYSVQAEYEPITYEITYNYDSGQITGENPATYQFRNDAVNTLELKQPTKKGYRFQGYVVESGDAAISEEDGLTLTINKAGNIKIKATWTANTFTFEYNDLYTDSANPTKLTKTCTYDQSCRLEFPEPNVPGLAFKYWYYVDNSEGTAKEVKLDSYVTNYTDTNKTYTVLAKLEKIVYTLSYNYDGGVVTEENRADFTFDTEDAQNNKYIIHNPTKEGYHFLGWTVSGPATIDDLYVAPAEGESPTITDMGPTANLTINEPGKILLIANWTKSSYSFRYQESEEQTTTISCQFDESCTLDFPEPSKSGENFLGFYIESETLNGTTTTYERPIKLPSSVIRYTTTPNIIYNVIARYENNVYSITYDYDGGNKVNSNPEEYTISNRTITITNPTKDGYHFAGWTVSDNASITNTYTEPESGQRPSKVTDSTSTLTINEPQNTTLTAHWTEISYTFKYQKDAEQTIDITCYYATDCKLDFTEPSVEGQKFTGFYIASETQGENTTTYTTKVKLPSNVIRYTTKSDIIYNVVAQYENNVYNINYEYNGGSATNTGTFQYNATGENKLTLNPPTKKGYTFQSWRVEDEDSAEVSGNTLTIKKPTDIKLVANWTANQFTFQYESQSKTCTYDETCELEFTPNVADGEEFKYWYYTEGGREIKVNNTVTNYTDTNKTYTLQAKTANKSYNISYEYNGGSLSEANPTSYTKDDTTITLKEPTKPGYAFANWTVDEGPATVSGNTLTITGVGDIRISANYGSNTYRFTQNKEGVEDITCSYDTSCKLDFAHEEIAGKKFLGFYIVGEKDGENITTYERAILMPESVISYTTQTNKVFVVEPRYEDLTYHIIYDLKGGSATNTETFQYNATSENKVTLTPPTKKGYTFHSWTVLVADSAEISGNTLTIKKPTDIKLIANWTANQFTFKYESQTKTCTYDETCELGFTPNVEDGQEFIYWYYIEDGREIKVNNTVTNYTDTDKTYTLQAKISNKSYNIAYEYDGGKVEASNTVKYTSDNLTITLQNPQKVGYKFNGWSVSENATTNANYVDPETSEEPLPTYGVTSTLTINNVGDVTLTAHWKPIEYTLKYSDTKQVKCTYDQKCIIDFQADAKAGQEFANWYMINSEDTQTVVPSYVTNFTNKEETITIYAAYTLKQNKVNYNYNDGTVTHENPAFVTYDIDHTDTNQYSLVKPTKTGYTFTGWEVDGPATATLDKLTVTGEGPITLKAKWTERTITINYKIAADATENWKSETCQYTNCLTTTDTPTKANYEFEGWLDENGIVYSANSSLNIGQSDTINLTAKWTNSYRYTITYDLDKGFFPASGSAPSTYLPEDANIEIANPQREGYIFKGWQLGDTLLGTTEDQSKTILPNRAQDITVTAKWEPITYKFIYTYIDDSGEVQVATKQCTYDEECSLDFASIPKKGYTLKGLYINEEPLPNTVKNYTTENNKEFIVKAKYIMETYSITYEYNGGVVTKNNRGSYTITSTTLNLEPPTKKGYVFTGWTLPSEAGTVENNNKITLTSTGDVVITANFAPVTYKFTYNGTTSESCSYDTECTLSFTAPTLPGKTFTGFYVTIDGQEVKLPDNLKVKEFTTVNNANLEVIAKYNDQTYTISYDYDGGVGYNQERITASANTFTLNVPTKAGYVFNGWEITKGTGNVEGNNITLNILENPTTTEGETDFTIKAKWQASKYHIIFKNSDGTANETWSNVECTYGQTCSFGTHEINATTQVIGWSLEPNGSLFYGDNLTVKDLASDGQDITLYAVTTDLTNYYEVHYNVDGGTINIEGLPDKVVENGTINLPATGTKEGYTFAGWLNALTGEIVTGEVTITKNTVFVAKWELIPVTPTYQVTYDTKDGNIDITSLPATVNAGTIVTLPTTGTKDGYTFAGWKDTTNGGTYTDKITINANTTLEAIWNAEPASEPVTYTISYESSTVTLDTSDDSIYPKTAQEGTEITLPQPTAEGYTFTGWKDLSTNDLYTDTFIINSNTNLEAVWQEETV